MAGRIVLAATPIGNVGDGSARLWTALSEADVIAAEDTRSLRDLARRGGIEISAQVVAMHEHNEDHAAGSLVKRAAEGALVVVVSDAGMPTVSDPGLRLVAVRDQGAMTALLESWESDAATSYETSGTRFGHPVGSAHLR